jgi:hypothetical protein
MPTNTPPRTPPHIPPTPPAYVAPIDPNAAILKEINVLSGGRWYNVPANVPCRIDGIRAAHPIISMPSRKLTFVVSCDGPGNLDQVNDEPTPWPIVPPQPKSAVQKPAAPPQKK